jgi:hypothetical protein
VNIGTAGAFSINALSISAHSLSAVAWSVIASARASSILPWISLSQKPAIFTEESLPGWKEPQPNRMFRKSDAAG